MQIFSKSPPREQLLDREINCLYFCSQLYNLIAHDQYLHIFFRYKQFTSQLRILWQVIISWLISLIVAGTFMLSGSGYRQYLGFACFFSVPILSFLYISAWSTAGPVEAVQPLRLVRTKIFVIYGQCLTYSLFLLDQ